MYKITFYAPLEHSDRVKNAMFEEGAGKIGNYSHCCWQVIGEGQFLPEKGSNPSIGKVGRLENVVEYKIEMVCDASKIQDVMHALKKYHPYEQPAYFVTKLEEF